MDIEAQATFDRAWRHFQLHAEQRIAVFNFFAASSGLLLTGLAYVLAGPPALWRLGIAAGALIMLLACVFWKLDQRSAQIIKISEAEIESLESASARGSGVFSAVSVLPVATSVWNISGVWTFGRSFRLLFLAVALLGLSGMAASIWRGLPTKSAKISAEKRQAAASRSKAGQLIDRSNVAAGDDTGVGPSRDVARFSCLRRIAVSADARKVIPEHR